MSAPPEGGADGIEPGRRLVRVEAGQSLVERAIRRLGWLAWRSPLHALRLRGRHPLKLLAAPDDPVPGDIKRGRALLEGRFVLRGEAVAVEDFASASPSASMALYLQSFAWLRDLSTVATRAQGAPIAEMAMRAWLAANANHVSEPAWRPDLWGRRILYWTCHAPLILSNPDLIYRSAVLNALARGARHLDRGADKAEAGLPRIAAWSGLAAAGLLLPGGAARLAAAEAGLGRALQSGLSGDGGVLCRAPTAQLEAVTLLAMLQAIYATLRREPPDALAAGLERAVPALLAVTHGDGGLASFQGSAPLGGEVVEAALAASGVRARPQRQARDWGYQRLAGGATVAIVDAAPPPLGRLNAGGCASTLAFELSDGPNRLIVNCGGSREASAMIPARLASGLRSTAAHSTLTLADSNSTAIHPDGALGRGVAQVDLKREETDGASRVEASHDGYVRRFGLLHQRTLTLSADGRELRGEDRLTPQGRRKRGDLPGFAIRFHLAPGVEAVATADGRGALLRVTGAPLWQFRCRGAALSIEESLWVDAEGRPRPGAQLAVTGETGDDGAAVGWMLKRAG